MLGWLKTYGYLLPSDSQMSPFQSGKAVQSAVATMQQFYGIPVTGVLDQTTIEWMKKPRCGVPDHPHLRRSRRKKRYALTGQKWRQKHITYSVHNYTPKVGEIDTRRAIRQAFDVWQRVTPLTFEEVPYHEIKNDRKEADIMIFFASGFHGDSSPFDGEGGFLAHAYFPGPGIGGDTHFDSDEPWTLGNSNHDASSLLKTGLFNIEIFEEGGPVMLTDRKAVFHRIPQSAKHQARLLVLHLNLTPKSWTLRGKLFGQEMWRTGR
ncbi:hypothetical protein IHE44_0004424 [Lamprotornis superbus]|uniref:Peptidase metallopeptidase domain-containing protein n=1 Tax=Lamprotornis superbus TaxID=245042 RepID=A0A835NF95_9PASS|nr:hypothetical protein IHE44_0004424 [Lamprotornis superbus]